MVPTNWPDIETKVGTGTSKHNQKDKINLSDITSSSLV